MCAHARSWECTWKSLQVTHPCHSLTVSLSGQPIVNESCTNDATLSLPLYAMLSLSHIIFTTHTHSYMMLWVWSSKERCRKAPWVDLLLVKEPFHCSKTDSPVNSSRSLEGMLLTFNKLRIQIQVHTRCEVNFEKVCGHTAHMQTTREILLLDHQKKRSLFIITLPWWARSGKDPGDRQSLQITLHHQQLYWSFVFSLT